MDTKDLTVVGVARSQCSVFAVKFCRRYTISSFIAPPNFPNFLSNDIKASPDMCVKCGLDPMSNFVFFWIFDFPRHI